MSFLVVANFKSNKTVDEVQAWLKQVPAANNVIVAPSTPHLLLATKVWKDAVCAQDVSNFPSGAYTGATNAGQLKDIGVKYAIIGHSERRHYFHETAAEVANKARELVSVGITPILCMEEGDIVPQFAALDDELIGKCLYCFEPQSSIGGVNIEDKDIIERTVNNIKRYAPSSSPMYGGSVNPNNIKELLAMGLGGTIVSSACLDPDNFISLLAQITDEEN